MSEIAPPRADVTPGRRARLGYAMTLASATLFAVNDAVSKVILDTGICRFACPSFLRRRALSGSFSPRHLAEGIAFTRRRG
jgi:hypothetical protein